MRDRSSRSERVDELSESGGREACGLFGGEGAEDKRADDEGEDGAGVLIAEASARAIADRLELGVDHPADLAEEARAPDRLGEEPDPAARGRDVCARAQPKRAVGVGEEGIALSLVEAHAIAEAGDELREKRLEHLVFAFEVMVEEALGEPGLVRDGGDGRAGVAMIGEDSGEGAEDLSAAFDAVTRSSH